MLVDTDVLIWYMKGNQKAKNALDTLESLVLSAVNYMELMQGIQTKMNCGSYRNLSVRKE